MQNPFDGFKIEPPEKSINPFEGMTASGVESSQSQNPFDGFDVPPQARQEEQSINPFDGFSVPEQEAKSSGLASAPFLTPPDGTIPVKEQSTALGAGGREAALSVAPAFGSLGAGVLGAKLGALAGTAVAPGVGTAIGGVAGGLLGAFGGGWATEKLQAMGLHKLMGDEKFAQFENERAQAQAEHPYASFAGSIAGSATAFGFNPRMVKRAAEDAARLIRASAAERATILASKEGQVSLNNLINVAMGSGTQAGMEAYNQIQQGDFDPIKLAGSIVAGAMMNDPLHRGTVPKTLRKLQIEAESNANAIKSAKIAQEEIAAQQQAVQPQQEQPAIPVASDEVDLASAQNNEAMAIDQQQEDIRQQYGRATTPPVEPPVAQPVVEPVVTEPTPTVTPPVVEPPIAATPAQPVAEPVAEPEPKQPRILATAAIDKKGKIAWQSDKMASHPKRFGQTQRGFIDQDGKFVDRETGMQIAKQSGQVPSDLPDTELHSHMLRGEAKPSLVEAVERGMPVTPPKAATFVRITDTQGRSSTVPVGDMDTLAGTGVAKVEFGIKGKEGFKPVAGEAKYMTEVEGENVEPLGSTGREDVSRSANGRGVPSTSAATAGLPRADKSKLKSILKPMLGEDAANRLEVVDRLYENGAERLGKYQDRWITISEGAANKTDVAHHEAVHAAEDLFLTPDERATLNRLEPNAEIRANKFIEYANSRTGVVGRTKFFFEKLLTRLRKLFGAERGIEKLNDFYAKLKQGELAKRTDAEPLATEPRYMTATAKDIEDLKDIGRPFVGAGKTRAKGVETTATKSPFTTPAVESEITKLGLDYESQQSKKMADAYLAKFRADPSSVSTAEQFVREPTAVGEANLKGPMMEALYKHYNAIGDTARATSLADYWGQFAREAGQASQAARFLNALTGTDWMRQADAYLKERGSDWPSESFRTDVANEFTKAAGLVDEAKRQEALYKAIGRVATLVPIRTGDWVDAYRYTNMLSNPQATERNLYGNTFNALVTRPLSLLARGDIKGATTYLRKSFNQLLTGQAFKDASASFRTGEDFSKYAESLEKGPGKTTSIFDAIKRDIGPQSPIARRAWKALTSVPRFMGAQDTFYGSMIEAGEMARLLQAGETPERAAQLAKQLSERYLYRERLGASDKSMDLATRALDNLGVFLDKGRHLPIVGKGLSWLIPFLKTPINIAKLSVQTSPLAYLGLGMSENGIARAQFGKDFSALKAEQQMAVTEQLRERTSLAAIGTGVTVIGALAAAYGKTTWGAPKDETARKLFYSSGRRPYSFEVNGKWYPMAYLGPFMVAFAIPAAAREAYADNPDAVTDDAVAKLGRAAAGIPQIVLSQTPLTGLSGALDALNGKMDKTISSQAGSLASQFIPGSGFLRWVNKIVDPTYRKAVTAQEGIETGIPGLSDQIQPYLDERNQPVGRPLSDQYAPYTVGEEARPGVEETYQQRMNRLKMTKIASERQKEAKENVRKARFTIRGQEQ